MSFQPLNFDAIKDEERSVLNSDTQIDILNFFERAINSSPQPNIEAKSTLFIKDLVAFAPEENSGLDADTVACATWTVINASGCTPPRHYAQDILVRIVELLGDAGDTWKGYPGFGMFMREAWNRSPVFQIDDDDDDDEIFTLDEWLNLNSFVARLGKQYMSFGLWEMRNGLEGVTEDEKPAPEDVVNTRILVATEWIIQGGRGLLRESLIGGLSFEPSSGKPWIGGPFFAGNRGFNLERWEFWKRRFGEVRDGAVESTQKSIDEAVGG